MEATMSEPRELAPEQNHTPSDGLTYSGSARPEVNTLLTRIADTLSTIQQQQPLPLPSLPSLPTSSVTNSLTPLPSLPNFDPSALLNSLTSQASLDNLLDSLSRVQSSSSPLLCSVAPSAPPSTVELSVSPDHDLALPGITSNASSDPVIAIAPSALGLTDSPSAPLANVDPPVVFSASTELPAVALACTISTGMAASALPPAIITDSIFPHINSAPVSEAPPPTTPNLTSIPPDVTVPSSTSSETANTTPAPLPINHHTRIPVTATPLPLPPSGTRAALAINGVPAVTATVVARAVGTNASLPLLPPPVGLMASALPQVASSPTHPPPVSSVHAPLTQQTHSLGAPLAFTATPLTISHTSLPISSVPGHNEIPAAQPATVSAVPSPPSKSQDTPLESQPTSANQPIIQGPPPNIPTSSVNEVTSQETAPTLQTSIENELISQEPPPVQVSTTNDQGLAPNLETTVANELISQGQPPTSTDNGLISLGPTLRLPDQLITPAPDPHQPSPPSLHANEELLSEDSEVEMETTAISPVPVPSTTLPLPLAPTNTAGSRSDSASPYTDDASFASFVAGEAHDSGSVVDEDHYSHSPSPLPSVSQSIDALVTQLHSQHSSSSQLAMQAQFGVTAYCPRNPSLPPANAPPAPLDKTAQNFPKRSKYAHRAAMSAMHPYHRTRGGGVNVAKTLDLLKAVLQSSFNMEVKRLCDDYLALYSQAAANIRQNTGDTVPEATLHLLVNKMLEEAQHGYQKGEWEFPSGKLPRNQKVTLAKASPMANKKVKGEKGEARYGPPKRSRRPPAEHHSEKTSWKWSMDKKRVDPGKWKPETLSTETAFVLGVNVNKALGHAANRGKVYYLHPELFKYACDGDDKTWLYENKFLPVHGGKAFLMILKEVKCLVSNDECYKDNDEILCAVKKLQEFQVPQFMLDKMKTFMRSVQGYFAQESSCQTSTDTAHESSDASHQKS